MFLKRINTFILVLIMSLIIKKNSSGEILLDNFNNTTDKQWEFISDQVMGGVSFGDYQIVSESNLNFLRLSGFVSLENNGGFIQVRKRLSLHKNKDFRGIKLKCRGNNNKYFIHIRTKFTLLPWQYYQSKFFASENWQEHKLDLNSFERSGALLPRNINSKHIKSIALVAFGRKHRVNLEVSEINFF